MERIVGTGIEHDDRSMVPAMGDFDDPAIDDRYAAAVQLCPDIGCNFVSIG